MTIVPAPSTENQPDLFNLAATALGCDPVYLLKVRQQDNDLVVILATGQKFTFDPGSVAADLLDQVSAAIGQLAPTPAAPIAPPPRASRSKK